ncbi:hypothetical protein QYF61_000044 [Mycteria americana]|uniref:Ig-like domain-containing protein n=1 Tax=Mycteria americana TaxID=33587 RepID=A0AAN7P9B8_MYCAM|nr:hypothetical protein QYF61_000044 [Mycteria americana]
MLAGMALALEQSLDTVIRQGQSVNLSCSKKQSSSTAMYWYKLTLGKDSRLILVASALEGAKANVEDDFKSHFKSSEIQGDRMTLLIEHAFLNDSGTYYCAETFPPRTSLCLCCHHGQVVGRRWPFSMVLHWFLVAILAPVGQALQQSPDMAVRVGDSVTLNCSQKGSAFSTMYWYKLSKGKDATLQLIVQSVEGGTASIEKEFSNHFQSNGTKGSRLSVEIGHALLNDSGTYFCAEQDPQ